jgi:putative FmdB family regulatory protein
MPTYDYECRSCGHRIEVIHAMTDPGPKRCERCRGPLRRVLFPTGIIFKGSGFYRTDSRPPGPAGDGSGAATKGSPEAKEPATGGSAD